jgi:uncharacterized protein YecA (UPF0149 family)
MDYNKYVPDYLTGRKSIPRHLPSSVTMSGEDEAFCCAADILKAWEKVPGALEWLEKHTERQPIIPDKIGPDTPCPCGSGKRFKNCCGR